MMDPHLTSAKVDSMEMGYRAVLACEELIAGRYMDEQVASRILRERYTSSVRAGNLLSIEQNKTNETIIANITRDMLQRQFQNESKTMIKAINHTM